MVSPIDPLDYILLQRQVTVINANHAFGGNRSVLGSPAENVFIWDLDAGFGAGWLTISTHAQYDYETNPSIAAMTEISGGIGAAPGTWTGVPIIGFSVMAADIGHAQLGETVELIRSVNRN
ncbi:MAG: hypothetical protein ABW139_19690 [Candidatus Thiodiazotropha sp. DIVDIV]